MTKGITIHERFNSWQGEGVHMGRSAYFIRTYGCPVKCNFCDSAGTWHPDHKPEGMERMTMQELSDAALKSGTAIVVITGGEPAMHDWKPFFAARSEVPPMRQNVHLETSGAFPIQGDFDWITISPKRAHLAERSVLNLADEFKLIIENATDLMYWVEYLRTNGILPEGNSTPYEGELTRSRFIPRYAWLHPEWSKAKDRQVLDCITYMVKEFPNVFRAGWQLHKNYAADMTDKGTRKEVPLGGIVGFNGPECDYPEY